MLTREQLDCIPTELLNARKTGPLIEWLQARGWSLSLLELHNERDRRHIRRRPYVAHYATQRKEA